MSFAAMALTTSIAMTLEAICLFEGLRRKLGGLDGRYLMDRFGRILSAALFMAAPLALIDRQFLLKVQPARSGYLMELILLLPLAIGLFVVACKIFRVEEIRSAKRMLVKLLPQIAPLLGERAG
jgi:peptidoglycan biosynthesis protein MviN/MurJ (putative lipid II flippase)